VALQSWYLEIGTDQRTSKLFYTALISVEALSNEEEFQFLMMLHDAFLAFQNSYLLAEEGTIDLELREAITAAKELARYGALLASKKELSAFRIC